MPNRLAHQTSPYLLQHADNPVDWYPWGEEALSRAHAEKKPIFLSIGYAACHWCHVMAHESFEDPDTAALMNEHFINIKVDREERPDLDGIYMSATFALNGSGGWPLSVFLAPDLRPFYAGTYFPPVPRYNMPSFRDVLRSIAAAWQNERDKISQVGGRILQQIRSSTIPTGKADLNLIPSLLENAADHLYRTYDWDFGGWGEAPKFPQPLAIEFLIDQATRPDRPELRRNYAAIVSHILHSMARGGIYDVVGGGFSRYSTDKFWRVPHFEKMLYDNAQLARAYLRGYLVTGEPLFRRICEETLDFIRRELTHPAGGFFSSLDADSEGEEGKFYTWRYDEIETVLGEDFPLFKSAYGLTPEGNWEGKIILQRDRDEKAWETTFPVGPEEIRSRLNACHARLLAVRNSRIRPGTDDKVLTAWNALTLSAFAEAGRYLGRRDYLRVASRNAGFLLENLYADGRLLRSWRGGQSRHNAYLEDHAGLIIGLLSLYQSDPDPRWYTAAVQLADEMTAHYHDSQGGFFDTRADQEALLWRPRELQDNATPSGNSLAVMALLQLAAYTDRPEWRDLAEETLLPVLQTAVSYPTSFAQWLSTADFSLGPVREVAILGDSPALVDILWKTYRPRFVAAIAPFPPPEASPALFAGRTLLNNQPTAYVCRGFVCRQPVITAHDLAVQLDDA
jgi:uncharacterized protein YyaL (SSP411 family)